MAAVEGLHRRRAGGRGLDGASRHGRYSPWLGDSFATSRAWASAFSDRRTAADTFPPPATLFVLQTHGFGREGAGKRDLDLRRHRHEIAGLFKTLGRTAPERCGVGARRNRRRRCTRGLRLSNSPTPASSVPALAEGLRLTRDVIAKSANEPDALLSCASGARNSRKR